MGVLAGIEGRAAAVRGGLSERSDREQAEKRGCPGEPNEISGANSTLHGECNCSRWREDAERTQNKMGRRRRMRGSGMRSVGVRSKEFLNLQV